MTDLASLLRENLGFLATNRIPRRLATRFMGWFSRIEQPLVRNLSLAIWRRTADLRLHEAKSVRFRSVHDCFTRELRVGARPIARDPRLLVSPCDGIVGASGAIDGTRVFQVKGLPYTLEDLLGDRALAASCRDGVYVTLRLTASMYHRFHAPHALRVTSVRHVAGDTWNVNPIARRRIERLFCRNERVVIRATLEPTGDQLVMVPVAAILVAGIRLRGLPELRGSAPMACDLRFAKGREMGWFEHGSTILVFAPKGYALTGNVSDDRIVRMGEPLLRMPQRRRDATGQGGTPPEAGRHATGQRPRSVSAAADAPPAVARPDRHGRDTRRKSG